jgi:hypothetical protein
MVSALPTRWGKVDVSTDLRRSARVYKVNKLGKSDSPEMNPKIMLYGVTKFGISMFIGFRMRHENVKKCPLHPALPYSCLYIGSHIDWVAGSEADLWTSQLRVFQSCSPHWLIQTTTTSFTWINAPTFPEASFSVLSLLRSRSGDLWWPHLHIGVTRICLVLSHNQRLLAGLAENLRDKGQRCSSFSSTLKKGITHVRYASLTRISIPYM